jgi:hypothetical protein
MVRENNAYIRIPKNGISTFEPFLKKNGYRQVNLFDCNLDISKLNIWGHITNPESRHTKGVAEFLNTNPNINYRDPVIGKMLVSGMFDVHTYTIHMMLGTLIKYPITWIPLDATIIKWNPYPEPQEFLDGDALTNIYFDEQKLNMEIKKCNRRNTANKNDLKLREYVTQLKQTYNAEYMLLFKNVLEADILLYDKVLKEYNAKFSI